ncbi:MAG: zinc-finger domain-containing protein [Alphaproteobacteria bacterium]|nr:zinc-finger domain-containing protein [Alphaproteobacteria bacterium]
MKPQTLNNPEIILVPNDADEVCCDGGGGALGHPKVWYSFDGQDNAECGYCDRLFVKERDAARIKTEIHGL